MGYIGAERIRTAVLDVSGVSDHFCPEEWNGRLVYFVQEIPAGAIKIGVAGDLRDRLRCLQVGNPRDLCLIGAFPDDGALEKSLSWQLGAHLIRGEWFAPHPDVFAALDNLVARYGDWRPVEVEWARSDEDDNATPIPVVRVPKTLAEREAEREATSAWLAEWDRRKADRKRRRAARRSAA